MEPPPTRDPFSGMRQISFAPTFVEWQKFARRALAAEWAPEKIAWEELHTDQPALGMFEEELEGGAGQQEFRVPRTFMDLAQRVAHHREAGRWPLLYRVLWRLVHREPHLLEVVVDPDVYRLQRMDQAVRRDVHKMRAFVRFREVSQGGEPWYVAWFEPGHAIVELNAPFFRDRFATMNWSILTPDRCVHWDGRQLSFTAGVPKSEAPTEDGVEHLWLTYYGNIFNPARIKPHAMRTEMPKKYWKNLPEAAAIPTLLQEAPGRVKKMISQSKNKSGNDEYPSAPVPETSSLSKLREAAAHCTACPLYRDATQTVFGEGAKSARLVFVGEQPGDREDLAGRPFIGPAGQLFDRALAEAGIEREDAYVTNAVKHFKWEPQGKRRLHAKAGAREIAACRPWLEAELKAIRPRVLVLLGATAAQSVAGRQVRVLRDRGVLMATDFCERTLITVHPSSLLRASDEASRERGYAEFVKDLRLAAGCLGNAEGSPP